MFHTNPWNQNYHRGVSQRQLQDIYDYKKYIVDDNQINRKYTILNKENITENEQQRNTEVHVSSASVSTESGVSK